MDDMKDTSIVELYDENEKPVRFEHLMTIEHEGESYVLLVPIDDVEDVGEDEVIILRIEKDGDEEIYVGVEDEALLDAVFEKYLEYAEEEEVADETFEDEE